MKKLLAVAFVVGILVLVGPAPIPPADAVTVAQTDCAVPPPECEQKENVGYGDWLFGRHKAPSLHFIDFLELFIR